MDALQFYVGRWSCLERKAGDAPLSSTFTFALESNLMRQWIVRPKQGSMQAPYVVKSDLCIRRNTAALTSKPKWTMKLQPEGTFLSPEPWQRQLATIHWVDLATSTTLSRWEMARVNHTTFTVESFAKVGDQVPTYTASCKRE